MTRKKQKPEQYVEPEIDPDTQEEMWRRYIKWVSDVLVESVPPSWFDPADVDEE